MATGKRVAQGHGLPAVLAAGEAFADFAYMLLVRGESASGAERVRGSELGVMT